MPLSMGATPMNRRTLLKYGATGLAGLGTGYLLLDNSTNTAQAALTLGDFTLSDAETTTDDGTISDVRAEVSGQWEYDLPAGKDPNKWIVSLKVSDGEQFATVGQTQGNAKYLLNNGDYSVSGSITETDLYSASDFAAPKDKTKTVSLGFVLVFEVLNGNGEKLAHAELEDTASVSVTHEGYQASEFGSLSGSGELIIEA